jgi:hypothetical protein
MILEFIWGGVIVITILTLLIPIKIAHSSRLVAKRKYKSRLWMIGRSTVVTIVSFFAISIAMRIISGGVNSMGLEEFVKDLIESVVYGGVLGLCAGGIFSIGLKRSQEELFLGDQ